MADSLMSYAIAAGVFAFLTAVLFTTRGVHKRREKIEARNENLRQSEAA